MTNLYQTINHIKLTFLVILLSYLTFIPFTAISAAESQADIKKINYLEQCFFSCSHNDLDFETRLEKLEMVTYGSVSKDLDTKTRLKRLEILATKQQSMNSTHVETEKVNNNSQNVSTSVQTPKLQTNEYLNQNYQNNYNSQKISIMIDQATQAFRSGNKELAKNILTEVIDLEPDNVDANYSLGIVYESMGNLIQAATYYSIATTLDPDNREYKKALQIANRKLQGVL